MRERDGDSRAHGELCESDPIGASLKQSILIDPIDLSRHSVAGLIFEPQRCRGMDHS